MQQHEKVQMNAVGELSGDPFRGDFKVKTALSWGDSLSQDRVRRELLGEAGGQPTVRAAQIAEMLAQLAVRVVDAPIWWTSSAGYRGVPGVELVDDNVVREVFNVCMAVDVRVKRELEKQAEQAKADLQAAEEKP